MGFVNARTAQCPTEPQRPRHRSMCGGGGRHLAVRINLAMADSGRPAIDGRAVPIPSSNRAMHRTQPAARTRTPAGRARPTSPDRPRVWLAVGARAGTSL